MRIKTFREYPSDVLEACDFIMAYLLNEPRRRAGDNWRRVPYSLAIERAFHLLNVRSLYKDGVAKWSLTGPPRSRWSYRLELAGIDPATLQVVNQERWNLAWDSLSQTNRFLEKDQKISIALGIKAPLAEVVVHQKLIASKGEKMNGSAVKHSKTGGTSENNEDEKDGGIYTLKSIGRRRIIARGSSSS